jgi:hypothetical protein
MWKEALEGMKKEYNVQEAIAREEYKKRMTEWRIENEKNKTQKEDPLELFQENENERKRQRLASEEEERFGYGSDGERHIKKCNRASKEASRDREGSAKAGHVACGTVSEGNSLDYLLHTTRGNPAPSQLVLPHFLGQNPFSSCYPYLNPAVVVPYPLTLQQQRK